jgi:8-oxo-dGTP pyrophosphatase MutT (NUDIX family)
MVAPRVTRAASGDDSGESPYAAFMQLPVALRRLAYRAAYRGLQLVWTVRPPRKRGVKCVLTDRDQVLLVRHTYGHRKWDLPGGSPKRHEPALSAAHREMREELAIDIAAFTELGELAGNRDGRRASVYCFQAEIGAPVITIDRGELAVARWFQRTQLPTDLGPYVRPIVARVPAG